MKRRLILLGPPGAGKGTVAGFLQQDFGLEHISSGQLLRQQIAMGTLLGVRVQSFIENGDLAPDDEIVRFMTTRLTPQKLNQGVMLDGFPRSLPQAQAFEVWLKANNQAIDLALYCSAPDEIIVNRITGRRTCSRCHRIYHLETRSPAIPGKCDDCRGELEQRADDTADVVKKRLEVYARDTAPLRQFYGEANKLKTLDCSVSHNDLRAAAKAALVE